MKCSTNIRHTYSKNATAVIITCTTIILPRLYYHDYTTAWVIATKNTTITLPYYKYHDYPNYKTLYFIYHDYNPHDY